MPALRSILAVALSLTLAGTAWAEEAQQPPRRSAQVEWNDDWTRFRPWEYIVTAALWTQGLVVRFSGSVNRQRGTFPLDERIVEAVSVSGTAGDVAGAVGDAGYLFSMGYRLLDSTVTPGLVWGNGDVALQMSMIDLEGFGIAAFVLWNSQLVFGRERPRYRDCPENTEVDCDSQDRYRSFIAGHALIATTAAGLTCVHHSHLPLYGGGVADDLACAGMIGVAAAVGLSRIMTEQHYLTDVLLAWGIGALAGYVVPSALHYGFGSAPKSDATARRRPERDTVRLTIIPDVGTAAAGATLAGTF